MLSKMRSELGKIIGKSAGTTSSSAQSSTFPSFNPNRATRMHYQMLQPGSKAVYKEIYEALMSFSEGVRIKGTDNVDAVIEILHAVQYDNPAIFWIYNKITYTTYPNSVKIWFTYNVNSKQKQEYGQQIQAVAEQLYNSKIKKCRTEYEVERAVHDYLTHSVEYMHDKNYELYHTLIGPLLMGKGVCEGIAQAATYLLNCYGVRCTTIPGDSKGNGLDWRGHAWNIVILDGEAYHMDATFDLECNSYFCNRTYFNRNDAYMRADHRWTFDMECNGKKYLNE